MGLLRLHKVTCGMLEVSVRHSGEEIELVWPLKDRLLRILRYKICGESIGIDLRVAGY